MDNNTDKKKWWVSLDEMYFHDGPFEDRDAAMAFGIDKTKPDQWFMIGVQGSNYVPGINGDFIVEALQEEAAEEFGEVATDWLDNVSDHSTRILSERLSNVFRKWLKENKQEPGFFHMQDTETIRNEKND